MKKIIVIGSGGHAKVVIDIIHQMNAHKIIGVTTNSLEVNSSFCGYPILGDDSVLEKYKMNDGIMHIAMGVGGFKDNIIRKKIYTNVKSLGMTFINVIHPHSIISKSTQIGEGVTIYPGVVINTDVKIGNNVIIATGATIDHETIIEDNVLVSTGATIGAYTLIKDGALLALGSKIISGLTIGSNSLIAAGSVVVKDVESNQKVFGIPAKVKQ